MKNKKKFAFIAFKRRKNRGGAEMPVFFSQPAGEGGTALHNIESQCELTDGLPSSAIPGDFVEFKVYDGLTVSEFISLTGTTSNREIPFIGIPERHDLQIVFIMPNEDVVFKIDTGSDSGGAN